MDERFRIHLDRLLPGSVHVTFCFHELEVLDFKAYINEIVT